MEVSGWGGLKWEKFPFSPSPFLLISLFCSRLTRAERLATQAINHVVNMLASSRLGREKRCILSFLSLSKEFKY